MQTTAGSSGGQASTPDPNRTTGRKAAQVALQTMVTMDLVILAQGMLGTSDDSTGDVTGTGNVTGTGDVTGTGNHWNDAGTGGCWWRCWDSTTGTMMNYRN